MQNMQQLHPAPSVGLLRAPASSPRARAWRSQPQRVLLSARRAWQQGRPGGWLLSGGGDAGGEGAARPGARLLAAAGPEEHHDSELHGGELRATSLAAGLPVLRR